ncbi:MAG: 3-isopropylmalate dehydratase large subunit [Planctomycetaceae bacterium]|jgi:3-isopropylmalate/(R)-2-methylmalate dehydratase large subunit|nr:3-isopropylmalate dehydratase large subunit [Planctomycetaceae bacterium]
MSIETPKTMFRKIWDAHIVDQEQDDLLYIDLHLCHEVTSPQAFEGLRLANRKVRRPNKTFAVQDHCIPTVDRTLPVLDPVAKTQIETLQKNCRQFGIKLYDILDPNQGIIHVVGPERGLVQPGQTIVCGDSHTSTHGAFGAIAIGIGTSEVEHVFATQTLWQKMPKTFRIHGENALQKGCSAKDLILYIIGRLSISGGTGYAVEFTGQPFVQLSMEGRMTVCNMAIEMGSRIGMIAPDQKTFDYLLGREYAPDRNFWDTAVKQWKKLPSDPGAEFDNLWSFDASQVEPMITWGTNPGQVVPVTGKIPELDSFRNAVDRKMAEAALKYMDLKPGTPMTDIAVQRVFIGSCTNGRIEDLRAAANIVNGKRIAPGVRGMVVPGSGTVKRQAELEGLQHIFIAAGFEWRESGCSMCLGMNPDKLKPYEHCASTSNRNFEGRQGKNGRTHLVSPAMAAAAAIAGHFVDVRQLM